MLCLLIVLFFAATGITLNHPDWVFGSAESRSSQSGTLPATWQAAGKPDWLTVVEYLRANTAVRGAAGDYYSDATTSSLRFKAPGYSADATITNATGAYAVSINAQGIVAVMNDFHRGRDAGAAWAWVIDLSAGFLVLISVTGLGLLIYLKKLRVAALLTMLGGAVAVLVMLLLARG